MVHHYTANGSQVALAVDPDYLAVQYHRHISSRVRAAVAEHAPLGSFEHRVEVPGERWTVHPVDHDQQAADRRASHAAAASAVAKRPEVGRVARVYRRGSRRLVAADRVIVGIRPGTAHVQRLLQSHGATIIDSDGDEYLIGLSGTDDPLDVCSKLDTLDEVEYAEPDFVTLGHHSPRPPENDEKKTAGDSAADQEYALRITEAVEAWKRQAGLADVTVAILDEGVQTEHGNLGPAISHTYDATRDETAQDPEPADAHGTACAGVAAAVPNQRSDLRGIASGCSIMAVRIGYTDAKSGKYVTKQWWAKRGIDWAWRNGAAVLSNSWGGTTESTGITRALERARVQGRAGKGCVVVVAAGNEDGPVDFPGTLPDVLTVSASNQYDEPKTTESADRERWWGSSFGPEVDVAAPGVDIYSTDNLAAAGYTADDYVPDFRGTSAATPVVAGAAALVLCANPELTETEVRAILCDTADKVGSVKYVDGRNDRMGSGRVNVRKAVEAALSRKRSAKS